MMSEDLTPGGNPPTTTTFATSTPKYASTGNDASFIHISDLHISEKRNFSKSNLKKFCDNLFPKLVGGVLFLAITGDFTDGFSDFVSFEKFGQQENDWKAFREAIEGCARTGVPILSVRGNHDTYDVEHFHHETNKWFREFQSELGRSLSRSEFEKSIHKDTGSFAIIHKASRSRFAFIEASRIIPSPHQYHGEFSVSQETWLKNWVKGPSNKLALKTYVFIHYPLGSLVPDSRSRLLRSVANSASPVVYLSGHIHSVVGKQGVQALQSHEKVDELQISDFKWSGTVRKVNIETSMFVDIPTIGVEISDAQLWASASLLIDPQTKNKSVISVFSNFGIISVTKCGSANHLTKLSHISEISIFEAPEEPCLSLSTFGGSADILPVDTRLPAGTFGRYFFSYWFEWLQLIVLVEYILLIAIARRIFSKSGNLLTALYLVLSPIFPNITFEGVYGKPWIVANSVAMFDLETAEIILDSDTTRVGLMLLLYIILATGINWKEALLRSHFAYITATLVMLLFTLVDLRVNLARGGLKCLFMSPHSWFIGYVSYVWLKPAGRDKTE
jgi:Icc-related predicted phosphoesterase